TKMDLSVPIRQGRLALGTWQGIYLWEHRTHPHQRQVMITLYGE
ncbi:MAG: YjbQ family protein, partial [Candidatus Thiodiazotropha sp. (ex Lucinoma borealis)]|nr:YjbQ family protein [Candidatus Thiodiazotropha sp. (ex Lucinoma borealis)]